MLSTLGTPLPSRTLTVPTKACELNSGWNKSGLKKFCGIQANDLALVLQSPTLFRLPPVTPAIKLHAVSAEHCRPQRSLELRAQALRFSLSSSACKPARAVWGSRGELLLRVGDTAVTAAGVLTSAPGLGSGSAALWRVLMGRGFPTSRSNTGCRAAQLGESCGSGSSCSEGQTKLLFSLEKSQVVQQPLEDPKHWWKTLLTPFHPWG